MLLLLVLPLPIPPLPTLLPAVKSTSNRLHWCFIGVIAARGFILIFVLSCVSRASRVFHVVVDEVDNEAGINNGDKVDVVEGEMEDFISALPC